MKNPEVIQFFIHPAEEGGYYAEAAGFAIVTQGETLDETIHNIREAVECYFDDIKDSKDIPVLANLQIPQLA